jgi:hypothetical protein
VLLIAWLVATVDGASQRKRRPLDSTRSIRSSVWATPPHHLRFTLTGQSPPTAELYNRGSDPDSAPDPIAEQIHPSQPAPRRAAIRAAIRAAGGSG